MTIPSMNRKLNYFIALKKRKRLVAVSQYGRKQLRQSALLKLFFLEITVKGM